MYSIFTKHKITKSRKSRKSRKSQKLPKSPKSPKSQKLPKLPKTQKLPKFPKSSRIYKSSSQLVKSPKIDKFLYPFWYNKIPFPEVPISDLYHDSAWNEHLKLASIMYGEKSSLPKGSILFHGSTVVDPVNTIKPANKSYFFFGLDAFISIWYVSESAYVEYRKSRTASISDGYYNNYNGYLNIYQTLEDIPYNYLPQIEQSNHPDNNKECENIACMHPQLGYHFNEFQNFMPTELSIEFTIPTKNIKNMLELIGVYKVNVSKLYENTYKNFQEFKALDAVMFETNLVK